MACPQGHGIYLRDDLARLEPHETPAKAAERILAYMRDTGLDWCAINMAHPDVARALSRLGVPVFLFALPSLWTPPLWPRTLAKIAAMTRLLGLPGFIADPEMGWSLASRAEKRRFSQAVAAEAKDLSVGVTTHDGLFTTARLWAKDFIPAGVWLSIQEYDHQMGAPMSRPATLTAKWETLGCVVIPSVGSFGLDLLSFTAYFQALPKGTWILWYSRRPRGAFQKVVLATKDAQHPTG